MSIRQLCEQVKGYHGSMAYERTDVALATTLVREAGEPGFGCNHLGHRN